MKEGVPSRTAYRVALRRAAHQVFDRPLVFPDPLALRILGLEGASSEALARSDLRAPSRPHSISLRAFLVARSRFAEDVLRGAIDRGAIAQYVLLGAGLDTFAYRKPYAVLKVFEVDHPATQQWKLDLLRGNAIGVPESAVHVPINFQHDSFPERLLQAGFDRMQRTVFAWLGVVPYLSDEAFASTLDFLTTCAPGSVLVMDYGLPREALAPNEQMAFDSLQARVTAAGEPFRLFFTPAALHQRLQSRGWHVDEDLDRDAINARYFVNRTDRLQCLGNSGHLLTAHIPNSTLT